MIDWADHVLRLEEEGHDPSFLLLCCVKAMSPKDIARMLVLNELPTPADLGEE